MKRLTGFLALLCFALIAATPGQAAAQPQDPAAVVQALDVAFNAHDLEAALALFADDAVVKDGDPAPGSTGNFVGKDQIREWLKVLVDPALSFQIESRGHQTAGEIVTWTWKASIADFKPLGVDPEDGSSAALVQGGKIRFYSVASSAEWRNKLFAATTPPASLPKTGGAADGGIWALALGAATLLGAGAALRRRQLRQGA